MEANSYSISSGSSAPLFSGDLGVIGLVGFLDSNLAALIDNSLQECSADAEEELKDNLSNNPAWSKHSSKAKISIKDSVAVLYVDDPDSMPLEYGDGKSPPNPELRKSAKDVARVIEQSVNSTLNGGPNA